MTQQENEKAKDLQTLIDKQEKSLSEAFDYYIENKLPLSQVYIRQTEFLRKSMEIAYMRGAESFTKYVNENRPHSWACTEDCCVCEGGIFMRDLEKLFLPNFKQQLQSPEPEGEKERGV
jgi:hypothetical protein